MVQPNTSFDEYASLTIDNYSDTLRDNVTNHIPLWFFMDEMGGVVTADGGNHLLENLDFGDNGTFKWFDGFEELIVTQNDFATTASFDWKEANVNIVFSEKDKATNSGKAKRHDLVKGRTRNAESTMRNNLGAALFYAGTEFSGKAIGGLQYLVADDPTTGIVGGINRATAGNEFWRNQVVDESVDSITFSSTTMLDAMELMHMRTERGTDHTNLFVFGNTYMRFFTGALNANAQYIQDGSMKKTGHTSFPYYMFKNAKVFNDPNCSATRGYALNTDYIKIRPHESRNVTPDKPRYPSGQRATVIPVDFMGNFVCGNASLQGVFHS